MFVILRYSLFVFAVFMVARLSHADDYADRLQRIQEQADRDRVNYAWLYESKKVYYAAIAYSPATGKHGYSYSYDNQNNARRAALAHCQEPDARIVIWAKNCYCALAVGKDGYGSGYGTTAEQARTEAMRECKTRTTDCRVIRCVFSGN